MLTDREKSKENPCSCFSLFFVRPSVNTYLVSNAGFFTGASCGMVKQEKFRENDLLFIFTSFFQARATMSNYYLSNVVFQATITESNSLLLTQLITNDPEGNFRRPPQAVLDQLAQANQHYKIGHLLCRSRSPDFLLAILGR